MIVAELMERKENVTLAFAACEKIMEAGELAATRASVRDVLKEALTLASMALSETKVS
jgi:hypothetical protein